MATVIAGMERFFDGIGLMTGQYAVPKRMIVGALAGGFFITYFKPSAMFAGGKPLPWSVMAKKDEEMSSTQTPWWLVPVAGAFVGGVLI